MLLHFDNCASQDSALLKQYGFVITVTSYCFVLGDLVILFFTLLYGLIHINVLFQTPGFYITMKTTISLTLPDYCVNCISVTSKFKECKHQFECQYSTLSWLLVVGHFKRSYKNISRVSKSKVFRENDQKLISYILLFCAILKNRLNNEIVNLNTNLIVIDYNKTYNDKVMFEE